MPGTIKDPRMNPVGERDFGTVFDHDDSHAYVYIKTNKNDPTGSRYFTCGTRVAIDEIYPAFLVIPKLTNQQLKDYQELDFNDRSELKKELIDKGRQLEKALVKCELGDMMSVQGSWEDIPVIFDLVNVRKIKKDIKAQPVIDELNKKAFEILNPRKN